MPGLKWQLSHVIPNAKIVIAVFAQGGAVCLWRDSAPTQCEMPQQKMHEEVQFAFQMSSTTNHNIPAQKAMFCHTASLSKRCFIFLPLEWDNFSPPARWGSLDFMSWPAHGSKNECQNRTSDRIPKYQKKHCQIECQNRMSENTCRIYVQIGCQKNYDKIMLGRGSLEVE